jgi:very-short-patch-repair endonuclease
MLPYAPNLKPASRRLRKDMTDAEQLLWSRLRRKQLHGAQFYRQKPLARFIVDFYCATAKLVIEVDGSQHFEAADRQYDHARTQALESLGLRVMRFDNRQVLLETDAVVEAIAAVVAGQIPPNPHFSKGGTVVGQANDGNPDPANGKQL